jgi:hypothetical protein
MGRVPNDVGRDPGRTGRQPGFHSLIRAGITNEGEAEQVARAAGYDAAKSKRW